MKRLSLGVFLIGLASAVLLFSDATHRRSAVRHVPRLAILQHSSQAILDEGVEGIISGLAEGGFTDGHSVSIHRFNAEGDLPTANTIAKGITSGEYDLVVTASTLSLQAVANANAAGKTTHVFALVSDPVAAGVGIGRDNPLEHPRHLVGYGTMQPVADTFRLAKQSFPGLTVVGEMWNPAEANSEAQTRIAREICQTLGIQLLEANVDSPSAVLEAASSLIGRGVQALWVGGDITVITALDAVIPLARQAAIPVFTSMPGRAGRGTLFDLGANYQEVGRLAGLLAAQILNGRDPATVAVENVLPEKLMVDTTGLAGLKDPWQLPPDALRRAMTDSATPVATVAKPLTKKWKVDMLAYINVLDVEEGEKGVQAGLREAGLVDGRDFQLEMRNAQGDMPTLPALVDAALTAGTDLLITLSTPTLQAAIQRARGVPIVFTFVADAVVAGAGRSNDDHLPNVTGVPTASAYRELVDIIRECLPSARRIGTLFVPAEVNSVFNKDQLTRAASEHGLEVVAVAANTSAEVADAAAALCAQQIDAVAQIAGNLTTAAFVSITNAARRAHVPLFGSLSSNIYDGAAVVVARDYFDGGRDAGLMAARIMRGEPPGNIPFQPLLKTKILVNPETARATGVNIPASLLARAEVIAAR